MVESIKSLQLLSSETLLIYFSIYTWHSFNRHTKQANRKTCLHSLQKSSGFKLSQGNNRKNQDEHHGKTGRLKWREESCKCFLELKQKSFFFFFSDWFNFPRSAGEKKIKKNKYIKLTNDSLKVQFPFKITNKQQHQQKEINPNHNPKGKTCVER